MHSRQAENTTIMKKAIIGFYIVLIASKFLLASHLDLFGDEAFYWQCAQRPSFSYIDHPPLTAMLVRAGTQLLGDIPLGVRFFFLICGAIFPIAIYWLMRPLAGDRNSWLAAGASMVFPGTAYLGLVAIPDVPMLLIMVLSVMCFERATREGSTRFWVLAGICGAVGFLTHYRFILLPLAAFLYLTLTSNGRSYLREKGSWVTGALLLSGLVPVLIFNLQTDFEPVRYYLSGRHALSFSFEKLLQFVLEQVLVATPFFFIAMMGSMALLLKQALKNDDRAVFFSIFALTPLLVFLITSPFEDSGLTTVHWPISGYVFLLPYVPITLISFVKARPTFFRKLSACLVPGLSVAVMLVIILELGFGCLNVEVLHRPFTGWSEVNEKLREKYLQDIRKENGKHLLVAADSYVLGAHLDFLLHDQLDIYVLDNKRNIDHGRAYQYRIWNTDEQALRKHIGENVLVIIEETALNSFENWKLQKHFCTLFDTVDYLEEVDSLDGRKRFLFLSGNKIIGENTLTSSPLQTGKCELSVFVCLDTPKRGSVVSGVVKVEGWAFKDESGVSSVEIMINDQAAGAARYGISRPDVKKIFSGSRDPNHPNVGFRFYWDTSEIKQGKYSLAIRVNTVDGGQRVLNKREITVARRKMNQ